MVAVLAIMTVVTILTAVYESMEWMRNKAASRREDRFLSRRLRGEWMDQ